MVALSELSLSATGAAHDRASAERNKPSAAEHLIDAPDAAGAGAALCPGVDSEPALQTDSPSLHRNSAKRTGSYLLKPLIAIATAQYVIVTLLAGLTAIIVASEAGKAINASLTPIIAALKRL